MCLSSVFSLLSCRHQVSASALVCCGFFSRSAGSLAFPLACSGLSSVFAAGGSFLLLFRLPICLIGAVFACAFLKLLYIPRG